MARTGRRRGGLAALALLAIALPGVVSDTRLAPTPASAPPALDRFLDDARDATPPTARILAAGAPPALVFYRATAALYPRRIYSAFPTDYAHGWVAPPARWRDLWRLARRDGAAYVLLWSLAVTPGGTARLHEGPGTLVRVMP